MSVSVDDLTPGTRYFGVVAGDDVTVVAVEHHGDASATLIYRAGEGRLDQRILTLDDLAAITEVSDRRWTFDADGAMFRLSSEARRMKWAHLADPFAAVDTSNIDPYPHQINSVYNRFLTQKPLRFLLADDPGAGKTIMSGLRLADEVRSSGVDTKWIALRSLLRSDEFRASDGPRKLIVFYDKDTLEYVAIRIAEELGRPEAVVTIHGGIKRHDRKAIQDRFRVDPMAQALVATDAAGEGVNLQVANLMVNYDLPWNPNRIEQRFGRIHASGRSAGVTCGIWSPTKLAKARRTQPVSAPKASSSSRSQWRWSTALG